MDDEILPPDDKEYNPKNDHADEDSDEDEVVGKGKKNKNRQPLKLIQSREKGKRLVSEDEEREEWDSDEDGLFQDDSEYQIGEKLLTGVEVDGSGVQNEGQYFTIDISLDQT